MVLRIVLGEACYRGNEQNARGFIRRASVKIVLSEAPHQTVAPEE